MNYYDYKGNRPDLYPNINPAKETESEPEDLISNRGIEKNFNAVANLAMETFSKKARESNLFPGDEAFSQALEKLEEFFAEQKNALHYSLNSCALSNQRSGKFGLWAANFNMHVQRKLREIFPVEKADQEDPARQSLMDLSRGDTTVRPLQEQPVQVPDESYAHAT